jgi:hypothetical protein
MEAVSPLVMVAKDREVPPGAITDDDLQPPSHSSTWKPRRILRTRDTSFKRRG